MSDLTDEQKKNAKIAIWVGVVVVFIIILVVAISFGIQKNTCNTELTTCRAKLADLENQQEECANNVNTITNDLHKTSQLLSSCSASNLSSSTSSNICDCTGQGLPTGEEERRV